MKHNATNYEARQLPLPHEAKEPLLSYHQGMSSAVVWRPKRTAASPIDHVQREKIANNRDRFQTHVKAGEVPNDGAESFADGLLRELNLAHVEGPDPADLVTRVDYGRGFALRATETERTSERAKFGDNRCAGPISGRKQRLNRNVRRAWMP